MSFLKIITRGERTDYQPGDVLEAGAFWKSEQPVRNVEVHLVWFTRGKGTGDAEVVDTLQLEAPQQEEGREFQFTLPDSPYSFSGKLITLVWAIEVVLEPGGLSEKFEFVMAPGGKEVRLGVVDNARR